MEIGCPACGRTLRLGDEHAGKQIRCPACQQISIAPGNVENATAEAPVDTGVDLHSAMTWHLRMPEGPIYGPIGWNEVKAWAAEGRIVDDCELAEARTGPWRKAADILLHVASSGAPAVSAGIPAGYPWATAASGAPTGMGYIAPHRGGLILVLGLISCIGCPLVSFAAWVMGSHDLREMRSGRMDKSGESPTLAGMIFGMIVSVLWLLAASVLGIGLLVVALLR